MRAGPGRPRALTAEYTALLAVPAAVALLLEIRGADAGLWVGLTAAGAMVSDVLAEEVLPRR